MKMQSQQVLDIDVGNTRIKWRWQENLKECSEVANFKEGAVASNESPEFIKQYFQKELLGVSVTRVRIASVIKNNLLERLQEICLSLWQVEPELAEVKDVCAGVQQGYEDYSRLGVDRWLAVLAAYNRFNSACLVVSCGTAITADFVDSQGVHHGGYIVPGLHLMRQSLFGGTDGVKVSRDHVNESLKLGKNTEEAVNHGMLQMVAGFVERTLADISSKSNESSDVKLVICGGDGEKVGQHLRTNFVYERSLVLDGLAYALPNQN